jgi:MSHA pilin protein MshD
MTSRRQAGFTLVELIFFIVVVSLGMAGILMVIDVSTRSGADPMVRKQAMALADSLMEEILLKDYADPDGVGGESTRATFDDVGDFNGLNETISAAGPVFTGMPPLLYGYQVQAAVVPAVLGGVAALRVSVTVSRGSESITMVGYRANY